MPATAHDLDAAIDGVRERVAGAAARAGRRPDEVRIVAVAKTFPPAAVEAAVARGLVDIGENRAAELLEKQEALHGLPIRWHFVGPLQRNKARHVVGRVTLIHSVDSEALGREIGARAVAGASQDVLMEVNVAGEATKHGAALDGARALVEQIAATDGLRLRGFMTMPPHGDAVAARAAFATLRALRDEVARRVPAATELSMGMSDDLEIAVEEGATMVRIGTAIFGPRQEAR